MTNLDPIIISSLYDLLEDAEGRDCVNLQNDIEQGDIEQAAKDASKLVIKKDNTDSAHILEILPLNFSL